jgi:hypothetical protein
MSPMTPTCRTANWGVVRQKRITYPRCVVSDGKKLETFQFFAVWHDTPWVSNSCAIRHQFAVQQVGVIRQVGVARQVSCKQTISKVGERLLEVVGSDLALHQSLWLWMDKLKSLLCFQEHDRRRVLQVRGGLEQQRVLLLEQLRQLADRRRHAVRTNR